MDEPQYFETKQLPCEYDELAPDGSEIRFLMRTSKGQLTHCTLPPNETSDAVYHRTIEEIWYCVQGRGEVWRKLGDKEEVTEFEPEVCLSIPNGTRFQFRNTGEKPLKFIIATMPPWPGNHEAVKTNRFWAKSTGAEGGI